MGQVEQFYEQIKGNDLPIWVGEKYLEYHRGTYTTQSQIKSLHRRLENALVEGETAAILASKQGSHTYPAMEFARLWQILLLNEFHDILPGSSINSVYKTAKKRNSGLALETARAVRDNALGRLSLFRPIVRRFRYRYLESATPRSATTAEIRNFSAIRSD